LLDKANQLRSPNDNTPARIIIAISGTPGSGKSTLANKVTALLNESTPNIHNPRATVVPMDGFHLTRGQLDQFPDPVLAHRRPSSSSPSSPSSPSSSSLHNRPTLLFPSFDHALKDPVADGIKVSPDTSIIILEGLYLHLDQSPWNTIPGLVDDKWFIDIDDSLARTRVAKRHLQCGIVDKLDEGYRRYDDNDRLNAAEVVDHRVDANV
ncbi:P-loop containing nucleoside triphosphate hydrolase protein, partial [Nadsonia fulvescens var. elongata DSM 6958]